MGQTVKRVDFHTHIMPIDFPDFGKLFGGERWPSIERINDHTAQIMVQGNIFRKITKETWDPAKRLEQMALEGIDIQVLSPIPITLCYWAPLKGAVEFAKLQNDYMANIVKQHPDSFLGLGTVPLQDVEAAIEEMDRCVHQLKLSGLEIGTNINGMGLDDPCFLPFFEKAEQWNVPLFIHPYEMVGKERTANDNLAITVGMPMELSLAATRLIWAGIFDKFPNIKLCLAHGGGAFPYILPRIDTGWNAWPHLRKTEKPPSSYANKFYYDALVYDSVNTQYLIDLVGYERLIMGSDYPFVVREAPPGKTILEMESLSSEHKVALLGGNVLHFLNKL